VLHDQEVVVVLLQDGHELEGGKGPANLQLGEIAIQAAEDAGVVATDKEDFEALQGELAVQGFDQHLHGGDQDIEGLFEQGRRQAGVRFSWAKWEDVRDLRGWEGGAKVRTYLMWTSDRFTF
jgi:hypothetical protein